MKQITLLVILAISVNALSYSKDCEHSKKKLEDFIHSQTNNCQKDSDCDGYYIRGDSCAPSVVLAKKVYTKSFQEQILKLQMIVRKNCENDWKNRTACEPQSFQAICKKRTCVDMSK